jgi:hypothetical protein
MAPKPGVVTLRPLGAGEVLDGAFSAMRMNPAATLGITFFLVAVVETIRVVVAMGTDDTSTGMAAFLQLVVNVLYLLLSVILSGVLSIAVSEAVLGQRISAGDAARRIVPRLPGLVGLSIAVTALILIGLLALLVGAIYVFVVLALATPAYVLEGGTVGDALRRSRYLVRGAWWRTFGILLLSAAVTFLLELIILIPKLVVIGSSRETFGDPTTGSYTTAGHIVDALGNLIATSIGVPVLVGAIVLIYVDRRIRREGFDVTLAEAARQRAASPDRVRGPE